jgi:hypothetical protein
MKLRNLLAAAIVQIGATTLAFAQPTGTPTPLGTFKQWGAYTSDETDGKMCFIASQPTDSKSSQPIKGRDPAFFMITVIPAKKIANEASTIIGYPFKDGSKVSVNVDGAKFVLFTDKDSAWVENPAQEPQLIAAMKGGHNMTVQGTSRRGTITTDTYSLAGISAALDAMAKACPGP